MKHDISKIRTEYVGEPLSKEHVLKMPNLQFDEWLTEAINAQVPDATAMALATVAEGIPSVRMVLLKDHNKNGLTFFTNHNSRKGYELDKNPFASVLFFWPQLHRQVRVSGFVAKVPRDVAEKYFTERPRSSQVAAWVSEQSSEIESRQALEQKFLEFEQAHAGRDIPCPPWWGGYCLKPAAYEFWQGQPDRLHNRVMYSLDSLTGQWLIGQLAP